MKRLLEWHKNIGLRGKFASTLILSAILCTVFFFVLNALCNLVLLRFVPGTSYETRYVSRKIDDLKEYVSDKNIGFDSLDRLKKWEKHEPLVLLELYDGNRCFYSSIGHASNEYISPEIITASDSRGNIFEFELDGRPVTALLYFDFTYQYYVFSISFSIVVSLIIFILIFIYSMGKLTKYVCRLSNEVQILEGGNLDYDILETGNDELTNLARSLNQMRSSFKSQLENEQKIHTAYRQFITELSHDLRTPLTSLIMYTEILRSNRYENERQLRDYLEKIDSKAQHIKQLSDYLFEYALDRLPTDNGKRILMQAAFSAVMNDVIGDLEVNGFEITKNIEWRQLYVKVNPEYVRRIFENIQSNIRRYAERSADVLVESVFTEKSCGFSFMNTVSSGRPLIEGTGIGITNVRSMMSEMGGTCSVEETDSVFEITIMFPIQ